MAWAVGGDVEEIFGLSSLLHGRLQVLNHRVGVRARGILPQTQNVPLFSSPVTAGDEGPIEALAETDVHRYQKIRLKEPHTLSDQE